MNARPGNRIRFVGEQLSKALSGLTVSDMERIIIAYEPVWAIGTGKTASPEQAQEMHAFIRKSLSETHGIEVGEATRILYGGSVKPAKRCGTDVQGRHRWCIGRRSKSRS